VARDKGRDRLAAVIQNLLPVDRQDRLALHKVLDRLAQPQRMDVAVGRIIAPGAHAVLRLAVGELARRQRVADDVIRARAEDDD
jgi:hypothetical protein